MPIEFNSIERERERGRERDIERERGREGERKGEKEREREKDIYNVNQRGIVDSQIWSERLSRHWR